MQLTCLPRPSPKSLCDHLMHLVAGFAGPPLWNSARFINWPTVVGNMIVSSLQVKSKYYLHSHSGDHMIISYHHINQVIISPKACMSPIAFKKSDLLAKRHPLQILEKLISVLHGLRGDFTFGL